MKRIQVLSGVKTFTVALLLCGIYGCKPSQEAEVKSASPSVKDAIDNVSGKTIFDPTFISKVGSYSLLMPGFNNPLSKKDLCAGGSVAVSVAKSTTDAVSLDILCPSIAERERQLVEAIANASDATSLRDSYSYDIASPLRSVIGTTKNYKRTIQLTRAQDGHFVGCKSGSCRLSFGSSGNCELALSINVNTPEGHPIAKTSNKCALGTPVRSFTNLRSRGAAFVQPAVQSQIDKVSALLRGQSPLGEIAAMELGALDNSGKTEFGGYVTSNNGELGAWIIDPFSFAP